MELSYVETWIENEMLTFFHFRAQEIVRVVSLPTPLWEDEAFPEVDKALNGVQTALSRALATSIHYLKSRGLESLS